MFTGIISHVGKIKKNTDTFLEIGIPLDLLHKIKTGTSIAVNGVCLTVVKTPKGTTITVDVISETKKRTSLEKLSAGDLVNLELPATPDSFLSGHIVQGHIDTTGKIKNISREGNSHLLTISIPEDLKDFIVEKGSIALNGISLTIIEVNGTEFRVGIVPFTWAQTTMHLVKVGDLINVETDIIAKYVKKLIVK